MLVLSRKQHQSLVIGDNVKITVLELKGNQVRLGIDAPDSIVVHREEIHKKISYPKRNVNCYKKGDT